jgi:hypothetical protein
MQDFDNADMAAIALAFVTVWITVSEIIRYRKRKNAARISQL